MKTKIYICIILLSLIFSVCEKVNAQAPNWNWAKSIGGSGYVFTFSMVVDGKGNVYTTGFFGGTVDFNPGILTYNLTSIGSNDIFISKLDSMGNFVWVKSIGGLIQSQTFSITLDTNGNIYTTGYFYGTVDFDPGPGVFNLTSNGGSIGGEDIFILKLDNSGNFKWVKVIAGINSAGNGRSIAIDKSDNIYLTGEFDGTADFDPDPINTYNLTSNGNYNVFILKLNNQGGFEWAKAIGNINNSHSASIVSDTTGNVYITGDFYGTVDFNPDSSVVFNLTSAGYGDVFISKFDSTGNFVWAKATGGVADDYGYSIALDANDNVYTTGVFQGIADFDPDSLVSFNLVSSGGIDMFVSKLDKSGNFVWAKRLGGPGDDGGNSICLDAFGNVYTTGAFTGTTDFDPGPGIFNLISSGGRDIFLSKLDSLGNFAGAIAIGGTMDDGGTSIILDGSDNVNITGYFGSPYISFGPFALTNAGPNNSNVFVAKVDNIVSGIENTQPNNNISIYPNPATNHLTIALSNNYKKVIVSITDVTGKIIYTTPAIAKQKIEVNTKDFSDGIYFVQIQTPDIVETKKLIVAR